MSKLHHFRNLVRRVVSFAPLAWREIRLIGHFLITLGTRLSAAEPPVRPCVLLPKDPLRTGLVVSDTFIGAAVFSVVSQEWNGLQATQPLPPATCARSAEWTLSNGCVPLFPEKHHNIDTADSRCSTAEMRIQRRRRLIQLYCIPDPIENECCLRKIYTTDQRLASSKTYWRRNAHAHFENGKEEEASVSLVGFFFGSSQPRAVQSASACNIHSLFAASLSHCPLLPSL